jgi:phospholipid N-methyltransferase
MDLRRAAIRHARTQTRAIHWIGMINYSEKDKDEIRLNIKKDLEILSSANHYIQLQFSKIKEFLGCRILEIGAGIGNHTSFLLQTHPELLVAIEKEGELCRILKDKFGEDIDILPIELSDINGSTLETLKSLRIDTIISINVLEHIEDDFACLQSLANILVPGGRIITIAPASKCLFSELDRQYGHYRRYSRATFADYATRLNLSEELNSYFNMSGWLAWFFMSRIGNTGRLNERGVRIYDHLLPLQDFIPQKYGFRTSFSH